MGRCKDCKSWEELVCNWGKCRKNIESCRHDIVGIRPWTKAKKRDYVHSSNPGSFGAEMNVIFGADFGCIHFERRGKN